ncbi:unnamed protein product [Phaedon cochleariae]|uniref:snRNA-activating protein complex subunit 4 n=1 Tax=Phaedon cochleariae TaxID=80249 RepID=A0A9P0GT42_PHACE|nr:unnamed protein product [Phaedon cochleariae]
MDDEKDIKKMMMILDKNKKENLEDFQYEEFINCDDSDVEEINYAEETANDDEDFTFLETLSMEITNLYKYDPISSLRPEEILVIDSCTDPILKKILLLNRNKNMQLIQFYKKIKDLLIECKQNIIEKNEIVRGYIDMQKKNYVTSGTWKLGAPYFKDEKLYCSPPNRDTKRKRANGELTIYETFPLCKWTNFECQRLLGAVKVNYNMYQQTEIKNRIKTICSQNDSSSSQLLKELEEQLRELKDNGNSTVPSLDSDENIDWDRVAEVFLKDKHTAFECRSFWRMFLHPSINKSPWTPEENKKLQEIVKRFKYQKWDEIAKELGTNRSGLTACINYYSSLHTTFRRGEFTFEEDRKLLELISRYRLGAYIPWVKIVRHFKNRNRSQLHHRYTYSLSQSDKKKGKWTQAEDIVLMICVDKFGMCYKKCSQYLPQRSITQCKARYSANLRNSLKKGTWTVEEDRAIVEHMASDNQSWSTLVEQLSRCRGQLRQRYQVIQAFLNSNPDKKVEDVPKRKHGWKNDTEEETFKFMRKIADHYKNLACIPTVEEIQKQLDCNVFDEESSTTGSKIHHKTDQFVVDEKIDAEKNVDDMLTEVFFNSHESNVAKQLSSKEVQEVTDNITLLLDLLQVNLEIPNNLDNFDLDRFDQLILRELATRQKLNRLESYGARGRCINNLVPPNISNSFGLRTLLNRYLHFKSMDQRILGKLEMSKTTVSRIDFQIYNELSQLPAAKQTRILEDRWLFLQRFLSLFKWPAMLTLEGPTADLRSVTESIETDIRPLVKRTYSRKNKPAESSTPESTELSIHPLVEKSYSRKTKPEADVKAVPDNKKAKLAAPIMIPIKLTPVTNKSVLENLMKDKNKKLFQLTKVKCGKNVKTIQTEIKLYPSKKVNPKTVPDIEPVLNNPTASCSYSKNSETCSSYSENFSENNENGEDVSESDCLPDDASDLSKLESFLQMQKSTVDDDSDNEGESSSM